MGYRGVAAGVLLAGLLSACAAVDSTIQPRYDTFNRQLERARNEAILLNIVRASHDWPLSFSTVSQVSPTFSNVTTMGLPSFMVGPNPRCLNTNGGAIGAAGAAACLAVPSSPARDVIFGNQNNLTNGTTITTGFTVAPNEDRNFYDALLRPVDLHIISYFIRQGYSRELLFWLFADSIEIGPATGAIGYQYNPPYDFGCNRRDNRNRCLREWAEIAVITGLSIEERTVDKGSGGASGTGAAKGKGSDSGSSGGKGTVEFARVCFSSVMAERGRQAMGADRVRYIAENYIDKGLTLSSFTPHCGENWDPVRENISGDVLSFKAGPVAFRIVPRSAYAVFQFLGKILRQSLRPEPRDPTVFLPEGEEMLPLLSSIREDDRLLNVALNEPTDCFVETQFIEGTYCVPEHHSANTKHIFGLLTQLIALQTTASDLAITPSVRVVQ
jgi:hypothetical protein